MNKKFLIATSIALMAMGSLTGCGKKADFVVGISQLATHDALDAATRGFKERLTEKMEAAGKTIEFLYNNASGDSNTCVTIANNFVAKNVDLIMANATPALQAANNATSAIPILGTSITEYGIATGHEINNGVLGINVSGTSDLAPLDQQVDAMLELFGNKNKIGLIYCSAEANSKYQVDNVKSLLEAKGKTATLYPFSDTNDIQSICNSAASKEEAMFVPTDNSCAENTQIIDNAFRSKKIPVFCGEEATCKTCGLGTLSISYLELGKITGDMAAEILLEGADITKMAVRYDTNVVKKYNEDIAKELGYNTAEIEAKGYVKVV